MTTTLKPRARKKHVGLLPPTADVARIAGKDFIIMPLNDFEEWQEDKLLAAVAAQRLGSGEEIVPFEVIEARLDSRTQGRK